MIGKELAEAISLAYVGELSPWAQAWLAALPRVTSLDCDTVVRGVPFTGRQVVKATLAELPLPKNEQQAAAAKRLMELL